MAKSKKPEEKEIQAEQEIENLEEAETELKQEQSEEEKLKDQLLRAMAEYDNYRKRTARERIELEAEMKARILTEFLPVLDNLERALQAECRDENYKKGIEMIHGSFLTTLGKLGVEETIEEDFNPAVHQAVQHIEDDSKESGKVAEVFQKGYKIGSKVIRFAMVSIVK